MTPKQFVEREICYCVSLLISEMYKHIDQLDGDDQEALMDLAVSSRDWQEPAEEEGWIEIGDSQYVFKNGKTFIVYDSEDWERLCREHSISFDEETDAKEAAEDADWELVTDTFYNKETGDTDDAEDWEELCNNNRIDPYEREAYEHWLVSGWGGEKLSQQGETVRELTGLTVWARGTTGQMIAMDGVIQSICDEINREYAD